MKCFLSLILLMCSFVFAYAGEREIPAEHFARERTYHVLHYKLTLDLDEKTSACAGEASIKLVLLRPRLDTVKLDAGGMTIHRVTINSHALHFHTLEETLFVALDRPHGLGDTLTVSISYDLSSPKKGLYFIQPDSGYPDKYWQIWSQGENLDNHFWFPCYDFPNDKSTSEMIVTVNDRFTAISNGKLIDVKHDAEKHKATFHWYEGKPHSSYLISLVAGEFVELKDRWGKVPISNYVYKPDKDIGMLSFGKTPTMIDFYSKKIGYDYPWEKFAQTVVQDFIFGGMENVSAVTLSDYTIHDRRAHLTESSDALVAHELAHQWWGDLLTCRDWSDAWLNEGFATYFEILFQEYDKGRDEASRQIYDSQQSILLTDAGDQRRPTVWNRYVHPIDLFDNHIYGKGACVLHMLRFVLGDELFWKSMNYYSHKFAFQNVETNDLKIAIEEATGYNLHWFFDEWLYKAGYPEFAVYSTWSESTKTVQITVRQTQRIDSLTGLFMTPVDIEVWSGDGPKTYRAMVSKAEEQFSYPASTKPQLVIFDKGDWLLKRVEFKKTPDEWVFQLEHASDGIDRLMAVSELRWYADSANVTEAMLRAMENDPFYAVRQAAVYALGNAGESRVVGELMKAYHDRDARVRNAVVGALSDFKEDSVTSLLRHAFENDSSYLVAASALGSLVRVDSANAKQYSVIGLQRHSCHEVIRSAALRALADIGDEDALDTIKAYTKYGIDPYVRIQCLSLMGRRWRHRDDVVDYLIGMLHDPSFHVRRALMDILASVGDKRAVAALEKSLTTETDSRIVKAARDAIETIQGSQQ